MATHTGSGPMNFNSGSGRQYNATMVGGEHNNQYNANDMAFGGTHYENIQASGHARLHAGNAYNSTTHNTTTNNNHLPSTLIHNVPTKPPDDPIHADLIRACAEGQGWHRLSMLLSKGANVDHKDQLDRSPLHLAAFGGHLDTVRVLLDAGADIHTVGKWIGTPLSLASLRGHAAVVELILDRKANVNQVCGYFGSAAHAACVVGNLGILRTLKEKGARLDVKRDNCQRLIKLMAEIDCTLLSFSLASDLPPTLMIKSATPGVDAVMEGHYEIVKICLDSKHGLSVHERWNCWDVRSTATEVNLPEKRRDCNLVALAAARLDTHMLNLLLENGAPLADATILDSDQWGTMHALGADLTSTEPPPDHDVILEFISILLQNGLDVNARDQDGRTPLMFAVSKPERYEIAKTLLDQGASIDAVDVDNCSALMHANSHVNVSRARIVELLCERGANVHLKASTGRTAMIFARRWLSLDDFKEVEQILMRYGAKSLSASPLPTATGKQYPTSIFAKWWSRKSKPGEQ